MRVLFYLVIYFSALIFITACIIRALHFSRTPLHLRWELYPVPHEKPERARHGGSYFEAMNWWTQPRSFGLWGEVKFMAVEILFLKSLWEHNRKLWKRSFFFHFGLYLLVLTIGLLIFSASLTIWFPSGLAGSIGNFIEFLYEIAGAVGLAFSILGAIGLLVRRLSDPELKEYTTGADIFNLVFFIVTFALIAAGVILRAPSDPSVFAIFKGLLRFDTEVEVPGLLAAGLLLGSILTAYIPMTHMSHFIAKYFTYHSVRWDDSVNRKGGKLEAGIAKNLSYKPTWAAGHVRADGKRTWAEIAAINPAAEEKK